MLGPLSRATVRLIEPVRGGGAEVRGWLTGGLQTGSHRFPRCPDPDEDIHRSYSFPERYVIALCFCQWGGGTVNGGWRSRTMGMDWTWQRARSQQATISSASRRRLSWVEATTTDTIASYNHHEPTTTPKQRQPAHKSPSSSTQSPSPAHPTSPAHPFLPHHHLIRYRTFSCIHY